MSLHVLAHHMASKGRGGDSMLVHMSPSEVRALQALAERHGTTLTINPETGQPEAFSLKSLLPAIAGLALGPAGFGLFSTALGASAAVGGITALATGSLTRGLMAGLGAYGGASIGQSLANLGSSAVSPEALAEANAAKDPIAALAQSKEAATAANMYTPVGFEATKAGFTNAMANPQSLVNSMGGGMAALQKVAMAAAPVMAETPKFNVPQAGPTYIRPATYDPRTQQFTHYQPVNTKDWGTRGFNPQEYVPYSSAPETTTPMAPMLARGGIVALADGGSTDPYAKYNTLTGQSKAAYDYLMGQGAYPRNPVVTPPVITPKVPTTTDKDVPVTKTPVTTTPVVVDTGPTTPAVTDTPPVVTTPVVTTPVVTTPVVTTPVTPTTGTDGTDTGTDGTDTGTDGTGTGTDGTGTGGTDGTGGTGGGDGTTGGVTGTTAGGVGGTGGTGGGPGTGGTGSTGGTGTGPSGGTAGGVTDLVSSDTGRSDSGTTGGISDLTRSFTDGTDLGGVGSGAGSVGSGSDAGTSGTDGSSTTLNADGTYTVTHADGTQSVYESDGTYAGDVRSDSTDWSALDTDTTRPSVPNVTMTSPDVDLTSEGGRSLTFDYPELLSPTERANYDAWQQEQQNKANSSGSSDSSGSSGSDTGTQDRSMWWDSLSGSDGGGGWGGDYALSGYDGGGGGGGCPAPWINILLADGTTVQAGNMEPGMQVFTRHEKTNEWGVYPVTAVSFGEDERWEVVLEDGRKFLGTFNHRVCTDKDWVEIRDLQPGDKLVQPEGFGVVKSSVQKDRGTIVKITVADAHTYISEGFLSHNIKDSGGFDWFQMAANGGLMGRGYALGGLGSLGGFSDGGRLLKGPGDGVSDSIPATIGDKQPARLADGEFVVPARIVSELGNGSTDAGARKLYAMMDRIQKNRSKSIGKGKVAVNSRADKHLPA